MVSMGHREDNAIRIRKPPPPRVVAALEPGETAVVVLGGRPRDRMRRDDERQWLVTHIGRPIEIGALRAPIG
jgi:hypothetical protein